MLTRCPRCETTFRVTPEQLKARHGKVRCGECQEVFNALDTLIEAPAMVAVPAETTAGSPQHPAPTTEEFAAEALADEPGAATEAGEGGETPAEPASEAGSRELPEVEVQAEANEQLAAMAALGSESELQPEPASAIAAEPASELALVEPQRRRVWPWLLGILAALCTLSLQAAMHFRTEIAVLHPETRPLFIAACEIVGCKLLLPRKAELVSIETSDLHPDSAGKLGLSATLKNRAPFAQEFPHLEITLTDTADRALVRRVLSPSEYLPDETSRKAGFTAGREMPVELSIEVADVPAVGYRLYLFYP